MNHVEVRIPMSEELFMEDPVRLTVACEILKVRSNPRTLVLEDHYLREEESLGRFWANHRPEYFPGVAKLSTRIQEQIHRAGRSQAVRSDGDETSSLDLLCLLLRRHVC